MTDRVTLHILALFAGTVLGGLFFGGLWWTVKKGVSSPHPALLFFSSLLFRGLIVLGGFYAVGGTHLSRLLTCLLGFIIARFISMRLTEKETKTPLHAKTSVKEADHASQS